MVDDCAPTLSPLSNLVNLGYWVGLTVCIFLFCTRFMWNDKKYAFFRLQSMFINQSIFFYFVYFLLGLNSLSAWLVWFCHDWDDAPLTLIFYIVKIVMLSFVGPAFMLTTRIWIPIVMGVLALIASVVVCILFSIKYNWAAVCASVDIITMVVILVIFINLAIFKRGDLREWNNVKNKKELFTTAKTLSVDDSQMIEGKLR